MLIRANELEDAAAQLQQAAAAKKCWACGCLHGALDTIERVLPAGQRPATLEAALAISRAQLTPVRYDCLGCDVCFPAVAVNAIHGSCYVDRLRQQLSLEHYRNDKVLDAVVEGPTAAEVYTPAIERGLLSRLDHAAYVGRELARAEHALRAGEPYVQDGATGGERSPLPASPTSCCGTSGGSPA